MASPMEEAVLLRGGDSEERAIWITEEKYAQVWKDEVPDAAKRFYKMKAPEDGTYHIQINSREASWLGAKFVSIRRLPNYYQYVVSGEVIGEGRLVSFVAKKDEEFLLEISRPYLKSEIGEYCFSVCFDNHHVTDEKSEILRNPTCAELGERVYFCKLCGQIGRTEPIAKLLHTVGEWNKEKNPGCVSTGLNVQRCTVCGEMINQREIPATGHGATNQVVTQAATCLESGLMIEQCVICLETVASYPLPITDHTPGIMKTVIPASCTTNGRDEQRCKICNVLLSEETTTAYGHSYSEWETVVEPTKRSEGQKIRHCYHCAKVEYEAIEKLPSFLGIF